MLESGTTKSQGKPSGGLPSANRDIPITGTGQVMAVSGEHGGLVIYDKDQNTRIWSANVTISSPNTKLLDTGNLLVLENNGSSSETLLWQGFGYPTNTMLPFMKLGLNRRSGKFRFLTSWKSEDDPGIGSCSYRIDPGGFPQMFLQGMVIDESGTIQGSMWHDQARRRDKFWSAPVELCDFYGKCGPTSKCDPTNAHELSARAYPGSNPSCKMNGT
ncbi:unnamed protein product [Malus baccata var. baccata]